MLPLEEGSESNTNQYYDLETNLLKVKQTLAKRIVSSIYSLQSQELMIRHIVNGKHPIYVESQLDNLNLFIGFEPDPSSSLPQFITPAGGIVHARSVEITDVKAEKYVKILHQLKAAAFSQSTRIKAYILYKTPWVEEVAEIAWYNYFTDEVSLCVGNAYNIVKRKELLNEYRSDDTASVNAISA